MKVHLSLDKKNFAPGDAIRGTCDWDTESNKPPKWVLVSLLWHTEGKCTEAVRICEQKKEISAAPSGSISFEFTMPDMPISYKGHFFKIQWMIEAGLGKGKVDRVDIETIPKREIYPALKRSSYPQP